MRRGLEQSGALGEGFAHQPELAGLEIAQAAMNQLGRGRRGGAGIIALLGEHDFQPAAGGVARDRGAVNTAADDENVKRLRRHLSLQAAGEGL